MSDDRLTPEERAVIEAAMSYRNGNGHSDIYHAVDAYEASLRPQPVECLMTRWTASDISPEGWCSAYHDDPGGHVNNREVWRVTITPIERVR